MPNLPDYDPLQRAFHEAFDAELTRALDELPLPPGGRAVDAPCGDGFFARRLARRAGRVVGVDADDAYLDRARQRGDAEFVRGDSYALPLPEASFDLALCAMSFISLDEPVRALRELRRVVVPGGTVAVLESDEFHHVLLPWPVELEVAVARAVLDGRGARFSPARRVNRLLRDAGFASVARRTYAADRAAPFPPELQAFLKLHLGFLREVAAPHLKPAELKLFDRYADPGEASSLFRRDDAEVTCLTAMHTAPR